MRAVSMVDSLFDETARGFADSIDAQITRHAYVRGELFVEALTRRVPKGARVLDYGCGPGRIAKLVAEQGYRVEAIDPSTGMIEVAKSQALTGLDIGFRAEPDELAPLDEGAYDAIVCSSVIEYVPKPNELLDRFARALSPAGVLVLTYANRHSVWRAYSGFRNRHQPHLALQHNVWSFEQAKAAFAASGLHIVSGPVFFDAAPFDKRAALRPLTAHRRVGTLALVTAEKAEARQGSS